jgi:HPt (histidine-containing phosphotransfer) domain-containing protein
MPGPADALQAQLAKLRKKYGLALPEKISGIAAAVAPLFSGAWEESLCSTAYRQVHSLAGSSGTYGFPEISEVARAAEALLKQSLDARRPLPPAQQSQVDDLMAKLREMAAGAASQVSP